jgi:uncharacterized membrane protein
MNNINDNFKIIYKKPTTYDDLTILSNNSQDNPEIIQEDDPEIIQEDNVSNTIENIVNVIKNDIITLKNKDDIINYIDNYFKNNNFDEKTQSDILIRLNTIINMHQNIASVSNYEINENNTTKKNWLENNYKLIVIISMILIIIFIYFIIY